MISKLLIFNVACQSQILSLHILLPALSIAQSLILPRLLAFSCLSPFPVYLIPSSVSVHPPLPPPAHINTNLFLSLPHLFSFSLLAGSLKTLLSQEEGKVLFCLISLLSLVWRKNTYRLFDY